MPTAARELLFDAPSKPEFAALWWRERSWHIREAMDRGDMPDAYTLAASHVQTRGVAFADAEWLAGWIAPRFLDRPSAPLRPFEMLHPTVSTPVRPGPPTYWHGPAPHAPGAAAAATRLPRPGAADPTNVSR